jgi:hypothetical protein
VWVWSLCWSAPLDVPKIFTRYMIEDGGFKFTTHFEEMFHRATARQGMGATNNSKRGRAGTLEVVGRTIGYGDFAA